MRSFTKQMAGKLQSGESLLSAVIAIGILSLLVAAATGVLQTYKSVTYKSVRLGAEEDVRNYLRRSLDCKQTMTREKDNCQDNPIKAYRSNGDLLIADAANGIQLNAYTVKVQCNENDQGYNLMPQIHPNHDATAVKDLFNVPLVCKKGCDNKIYDANDHPITIECPGTIRIHPAANGLIIGLLPIDTGNFHVLFMGDDETVQNYCGKPCFGRHCDCGGLNGSHVYDNQAVLMGRYKTNPSPIVVGNAGHGSGTYHVANYVRDNFIIPVQEGDRIFMAEWFATNATIIFTAD